MSLQCGIVGLPNVGKSTLFNCLSNAKAQSANFPFCTIEPNVGVITVPDERLIKLGELCHPERGIIPTTVEIVDIAGLVKGASKGEGLGNKFLANIRETDAIIHVLRCFDDENVVHVDGTVDPVRDKEIIDAELQLKDLETVESRIAKTEKQAKAGGDKQAKLALDVLLKYRDALSQGRSARTVELINKEEEAAAKEMFLLTNKQKTNLGIVYHKLYLLLRTGGIERNGDGTDAPGSEIALNILCGILREDTDVLLHLHTKVQQGIRRLLDRLRHRVPGQ